MLDGHFRGPVDRMVRPIGRALLKTKLTPDHLTFFGLVIAALAAVAIGSGRLILGLILVILAALPDLFDGALAKASNSSSQRGAFFDSTMDRVTDNMLLGGMAWYFADNYSARLTVLPFAVAAVASLISYQRAKAESLGLDAKGGLMERAERIVLLCIGLLLEGIGLDPALAVVLDPELDGFPPEALLELDFFLFLMRRQRDALVRAGEQAGGNGGSNS